MADEVLPAIRKHGAYMTPEKIEEALLNPDTLIKLATELKAEREARKHAELEAASAKQVIGELKQKADYTDRILASKGTVTTTAIAKDYGMSATGFNKLLHELHVIYKIGKQWFKLRDTRIARPLISSIRMENQTATCKQNGHKKDGYSCMNSLKVTAFCR